MATFWEKLRLATATAAHMSVDTAINAMGVETLKQQVRDTEAAMNQIGDSLAVAKGRRASLEKEIASLQAQSKTYDGQITLLLSDDDESNDKQAVLQQKRKNDVDALIATKKTELSEDATKTVNGLQDAFDKVSRRHDEMVHQLRVLEQQTEAANAKGAAAKALAAAADLAGQGGVISADDISRRIRERNDVNEARFDQQMNRMTDNVEDVVSHSEAMAQILERKKQLQAAKAGNKSAAA